MGSSRTQNSTRPSKRRRERSSAAEPTSAASSELLKQLDSIARQLRGIYSVGVAVKLAIDSQIGEHGTDLSYRLGWHVLDPIAIQLDHLSQILVNLGGCEVTRR